MKRENTNFMIIYHFWIFIQGSSLALSFTRDLRNLTIIYKPNAFIYHICQTTNSINSKRIRWHYESLYDSTNDTDIHSNYFEFYYGPSISVLVIKEPDMFIGKYTCHVNINSSYEIKSFGWIDIKFPLNNMNKDEQFMEIFNENQLGKLANYYNVPFIFDENDLTSFGKRIEIGGIFHTECKSIESSYPINFLWIHLRNTSKGIKTIQFIQNNKNKIIIKENNYSSSLSIYSVDLFDDGDYVCIASNALGQSFSTTRSLFVSERMIFPHIHNNLLNHSYFDLQYNHIQELVCIADGYPIPDVVWIRVSDSIILAQNQSYAILKFHKEMHGVNEYMCEAENKHGLTQIFIYVIIPNTQIKPVLNYSDIQSRSVVLSWYIFSKNNEQFSHFIIYYRCLNNFEENINEIDEIINIQDYKQVIVDPRMIDYTFKFQIIDLIPFTKYEVRLKGFTGATPSTYSNPIFIETLETIPDKIENLHGYIWNETSVVIHWTPVNSTNGPNFYYVLYYTTNTSIPFDQWSNIIIRTYPFHILSLSISINFQLFIRIASVNIKGSILSDFYIINYNLLNSRLISTINKFQCSLDDQNQLISLQWSINHKSNFYIKKYILYYSDLTQNNNNLIRILTIPINNQLKNDLLKSKLNISLFNLNYNSYHILRLHLAIIDQYQNQLSMTFSPIYCIFTRKFGKDNKNFGLFLLEILID